MKLRLLCLALLASSAVACGAQTVTFMAAQLTDGSQPMTGTLVLSPVLSAGQPTYYHRPGGGIATITPITIPVVSGVFSVTGIPDTTLTEPVNLCFRARGYTAQGIVFDIPCLQPASDSPWCNSGTCDFDNWNPLIATLALANGFPANGEVSIPGLTLIETWNNSGTVFLGLNIAITNIASESDSAPIAVTVGGAPIFVVDLAGDLTSVAGIEANDITGFGIQLNSTSTDTGVGNIGLIAADADAGAVSGSSEIYIEAGGATTNAYNGVVTIEGSEGNAANSDSNSGSVQMFTSTQGSNGGSFSVQSFAAAAGTATEGGNISFSADNPDDPTAGMFAVTTTGPTVFASLNFGIDANGNLAVDPGSGSVTSPVYFGTGAAAPTGACTQYGAFVLAGGGVGRSSGPPHITYCDGANWENLI